MIPKRQIEVEKDEFILRPVQFATGAGYMKVGDFRGGDTHEEGGEPFMAQEGDVVTPGKDMQKISGMMDRDNKYITGHKLQEFEQYRQTLPEDAPRGTARKGIRCLKLGGRIKFQTGGEVQMEDTEYGFNSPNYYQPPSNPSTPPPGTFGSQMRDDSQDDSIDVFKANQSANGVGTEFETAANKNSQPITNEQLGGVDESGSGVLNPIVNKQPSGEGTVEEEKKRSLNQSRQTVENIAAGISDGLDWGNLATAIAGANQNPTKFSTGDYVMRKGIKKIKIPKFKK